MKIIHEIKQKIMCTEYARRYLNLNIIKSGDRTYSLSGGNNATCLLVNDDFWYDFKLSQGGDVIDLCAIARYQGDKKSAIRELSEITGVTFTYHSNWVSYTQNLCNEVQKYHENLTPTVRKYLNQRRISDETIDRLKIGFNNEKRIVIPYWKNGYISYYITRAYRKNDTPKYKKMKRDGLNENIPWGMHTIGNTSDLLVIAEGAFDALSFEQEGYSVLATMGGHFSREQLKTVMSVCRQYDNVFLCFDNDDAGNSFTFKLAETLFTNKIKFVIGQPPNKYKDVSDFYVDNNSLSILINSAKDGLSALCEKITGKEQFKEFAYSVSRFVAKPELTELFNAAEDNFPKDWFNEVKKISFKAPSEDEIAKSVLEKHKLRFSESLGFYEYQSGFWQRKTDTEIQSYVSDELGFYRTGSRISSITKLIKTDAVSTDLYNQKLIFNFQNGTLDLTDFTFREHRESDLSSFQVDFNYDPEVFSSEWEQFISDIAAGDAKRISLLQEMCGYVLFNDCSLQKCFFLMGEGANGKSVLLNVITEIFGDDNVSNVEMSALVEDFQRIKFLNSLLNISAETKTNVKGAEAIFKQLVVGDKVTGCFKGKDFVDFRSRAKMMFACNELINARDITYGFMRRICFIKFPIKFVEDPDVNNPNEKLMDKNITEKLLEHKSAIFNWILDGYKTLRAVNTFTVTDDEAQSVEEFQEAVNPVYVFIKENPIEEKISTLDLYYNYRKWCEEAGHKAKNRTGFTKAFKQSYPKKLEESKSGNVRYLFPADYDENEEDFLSVL
ncbi:MAG: phage/plasmid primase, P4 family [Firmicutes bacterium]|nr:phage/plasmid primase, P4 family [Bacillota bacterium]